MNNLKCIKTYHEIKIQIYKIYNKGCGLFAKVLLSVLCAVFIASPHVLGSTELPTANYLKVDVGGRPVSLGGVQHGSESNAFAMFYNPALCQGMEKKEVGFMHNQYFMDLRQDVLAYTHPTKKHGILGMGINYFTYGDIQGYSAQGLATGKLSANDICVNGMWQKEWKFKFGSRLVEGVSTGVGIKMLRRSMAGLSANGYAMDLGVAYPIRSGFLKRTKLALSVQNMGPGVKFEKEASPLPQTTRFGMSRSFWGDALNIMVDVVNQKGSGLYANAGLEYRMLKFIALRVGYKGVNSLEKNLTYGMGIENKTFSVDYGFVPLGEVGMTHRISLSFRFGKTEKKPEANDMVKQKVREAETLYGQGLLVDAYIVTGQVQRVAPWYEENNILLEKIKKDFKNLEDADKREKMSAQIRDLLERAEKFFNEGNLVNARNEFQSILGLQPDNEFAKNYVKKIEEQFKSFVESFYRSAMVAFASENYDKAKEELEKVLVIDPNHQDAKSQLEKCFGVLNKKQKELDEQVILDAVSKTLKEALKVYEQGKYEEAVPLFGAVLELNPNNSDAKEYLEKASDATFKKYLERGKEYTAKGEWEQAIKNYKTALEYKSNSSETKSLLLDAQRRFELQRKVISQNLYKQGLEAFLAGERKKAKEIWTRALQLDPDNEEARRGLARVGQ